jgi:hypothetical protein
MLSTGLHFASESTMRRNDLAPHAHRRGAEHDELRFESVVHRGVG